MTFPFSNFIWCLDGVNVNFRASLEALKPDILQKRANVFWLVFPFIRLSEKTFYHVFFCKFSTQKIMFFSNCQSRVCS